ncbi:MAG: 2OG-Fe(II) oxygenase [Sandaracinaceae bacterium]
MSDHVPRAQTLALHSDPVPHLIVDHLFGDEVAGAIHEHLVGLEDRFAPAGIAADGRPSSMRKNLSLGVDACFHEEGDETGALEERFRRRAERSVLLGAVDALLRSPTWREVMNGAPFPLCKLAIVNRWETQASRYGAPGDEYRWHIDRIDDDGRLLTIVYYVFEEPRRFEGGDLELVAGLASDGELLAEGPRVRIEPRNDRAVMFSARAVHRVLPTTAPATFGAGRFSVNVFCGVAGAPPEGDVY